MHTVVSQQPISKALGSEKYWDDEVAIHLEITEESEPSIENIKH